MIKSDIPNLIGSKGILTDNESTYLQFIQDCIQHADPEAIVELLKKQDRIDAVIKPSLPEFKHSIITNLLDGHKLFHLVIRFSKSLAIQKSISYSLYFKE